MKKLIAAACVAGLSMVTLAIDQVTFVNDAQGYSYMQINEDMNGFMFKSDWKSVGNAGKVGFFKYPEGLSGDALKAYIASYDASDAKFSKHENDGAVIIGDVKAGDRIGFYLDRPDGSLTRDWRFEDWHDVTYIGFRKNGDDGNKSKDEWMSVQEASGTPPAGAPLPGVLAVLLLAGGGFGAAKLRKHKAA